MASKTMPTSPSSPAGASQARRLSALSPTAAPSPPAANAATTAALVDGSVEEGGGMASPSATVGVPGRVPGLLRRRLVPLPVGRTQRMANPALLRLHLAEDARERLAAVLRSRVPAPNVLHSEGPGTDLNAPHSVSLQQALSSLGLLLFAGYTPELLRAHRSPSGTHANTLRSHSDLRMALGPLSVATHTPSANTSDGKPATPLHSPGRTSPEREKVSSRPQTSSSCARAPALGVSRLSALHKAVRLQQTLLSQDLPVAILEQDTGVDLAWVQALIVDRIAFPAYATDPATGHCRGGDSAMQEVLQHGETVPRDPNADYSGLDLASPTLALAVDSAGFDDIGAHVVHGRHALPEFVAWLLRSSAGDDAQHKDEEQEPFVVDSPRSALVCYQHGLQVREWSQPPTRARAPAEVVLRTFRPLLQDYQQTTALITQKYAICAMAASVVDHLRVRVRLPSRDAKTSRRATKGSAPEGLPPRAETANESSPGQQARMTAGTRSTTAGTNRRVPSGRTNTPIADLLQRRHDDLLVEWGRRQQSLATDLHTARRVAACVERRRQDRIARARACQTPMQLRQAVDAEEAARRVGAGPRKGHPDRSEDISWGADEAFPKRTGAADSDLDASTSSALSVDSRSSSPCSHSSCSVCRSHSPSQPSSRGPPCDSPINGASLGTHPHLESSAAPSVRSAARRAPPVTELVKAQAREREKQRVTAMLANVRRKDEASALAAKRKAHRMAERRVRQLERAARAKEVNGRLERRLMFDALLVANKWQQQEHKDATKREADEARSKRVGEEAKRKEVLFRQTRDVFSRARVQVHKALFRQEKVNADFYAEVVAVEYHHHADRKDDGGGLSGGETPRLAIEPPTSQPTPTPQRRSLTAPPDLKHSHVQQMHEVTDQLWSGGQADPHGNIVDPTPSPSRSRSRAADASGLPSPHRADRRLIRSLASAKEASRQALGCSLRDERTLIEEWQRLERHHARAVARHSDDDGQ